METVTKIETRYPDCDRMGIVHHAEEVVLTVGDQLDLDGLHGGTLGVVVEERAGDGVKVLHAGDVLLHLRCQKRVVPFYAVGSKTFELTLRETAGGCKLLSLQMKQYQQEQAKLKQLGLVEAISMVSLKDSTRPPSYV